MIKSIHSCSLPDKGDISHSIKKEESMEQRWIVQSVALCLFLLVPTAWSQVNISVGSTVTQDFSIGVSGTAILPSGWKVDKSSSVRTLGTFGSAVNATEKAGGNKMSQTAANGIYNFGAGVDTSAVDRAVGWLSSGSDTKSGNLYVQLTNNGLEIIGRFTISYAIEKYRNGSNPAGFSIQMYYSTDGSTWTSAGSDFLTSFPADADNSGFDSAPGVTVNIMNKILLVSLMPGGNLYLAWNYSVSSGTTTSNAQALGIDDISITTNVTSEPLLSTNPGTLTNFTYVVGFGPSGSQSYNVSGSNLSPSSGTVTIAGSNYEISLDNINFSSSIDLSYSGGSLSPTSIYVRLKAGLSVGAYDENISHSGGGAPTAYVICHGTVINYSLYYRSSRNGNWSDASTWECSSNQIDWVAATTFPTSNDSSITIKNGNSVILDTSLTVDQVIIESGGQVEIANGKTLSLADGNGTDLAIDGVLLNNGTLSILSGAKWSVNAGGTFIHNSSSAISSPLNNATLDPASTFVYRGSGSSPAPSLSGKTYGNLTFEVRSGATSYTINYSSGSSNLTINGNLTIGEKVTFSMDSSVLPTVTIKGNLIVSGALTTTTQTIVFNGVSAQTIEGVSQITFGHNVKLDNTAGLMLNVPVTINDTLVLSNGKITTGENVLTANKIARTNGYVIGLLRKNISSMSSFEIGTSNGYTPVEVAPIGSDDFTVGTIEGKHPHRTGENVLGMYWILMNGSGITQANLVFHYLDGDVNGNELAYDLARWTGSNWILQGAGMDNINNTATMNNVTSFSEFTLGEAVALPVELTSFKAAQSGSGAVLRWQTATEKNSDHFEISRCATGTSAKVVVGTLKAKGNSNAPTEYTYADNSVSSGKYVYELKEVDVDGTSEVVGTTEVEIVAPKTMTLGNYPNPFNPQTQIEFTVPSDGMTVVKVYNVIGQEVATLFSGMAKAGEYYRFSFGGNQYASGIYYYTLESNGQRMVKKMLLMK